MSNHLAIATVTAVLQRMLQTGVADDVSGALVTTLRPDTPGSGMPDVGVNIFLYQASPNPAWRNADLRTRRPKENLIKHAQAGLDLYYLLSFYGNEQELEPQRLLGSAIRTLVDQPILTPEIIRSVTESSSFRFLAGSTLDEQVQMVQFIPVPMTSEELSRIWSIFFQMPYILSFAFQATAVLIEGEKAGRSPLPVRSRQFYAMPNRPFIEKIEQSGEISQAITLNSILNIRGKQLHSEQTKIRIGNAKITPKTIDETEIKLDFTTLLSLEISHLKAGVQSLQIIHLAAESLNTNFQPRIESNAIPFILCATIKIEEIANLEDLGDEYYTGSLTIRTDLRVEVKQRVFLLLNGISDQNSYSYIFPAQKRSRITHLLEFIIQKVQPGTYLARVQIDGAESPLTVENDRYSGPLVTIP